MNMAPQSGADSASHPTREARRPFDTQLGRGRQYPIRLAADHEVLRALSVAATLDEAVPHVLQSLCEILNFAVGVMWTVDRPAALLRCAAIFHVPALDDSAFVDQTRAQTFAAGSGLPGRAWASLYPISIPDLAEEASVPRNAAAAAAGLRSAIAVSLGNGPELIGVMEFYSRDARPEDAAVAEILAGVGSQISQFAVRREAEALLRREQFERRIAGRIQQRLLPRENPQFAGYEISGRCTTALEVGGDCFDFMPMATGSTECLGVMVADASGHGIAAALLVTEMSAYVRALAMTCPEVGRLLMLVNQRITDDEEHNGFVTALLLRLAPGSGTCVYANAGHCPGLVFDPHGNVCAQLASTGVPLGIDARGEFPVETLGPLEPGELLLLYSDGAVETHSPEGEMFGTTRLVDVVRAHRDEPADAVLDAVFRAVVRFRGARPFDDDVTAVVIKRLPAAEDA